MTSPVRRVAIAVASLVSFGLLTGFTACDPTGGGSSSGSSNGSVILIGDNHVTEVGARNHLAALKVAAPLPMKDYSRDLFPHWLTATTHGWPKALKGCDTREAALIRDGSKVVHGAHCTVTAGTWTDPYTATIVTVPGNLDIDHMVPLANAWRSGAKTWTTKQRTAYANDPLVEVTAGSSANREKGDKGPEAWKPTNKAARCGYAVRWIEVKRKYALALTSTSERTALESMLKTCTDADFG